MPSKKPSTPSKSSAAKAPASRDVKPVAKSPEKSKTQPKPSAREAKAPAKPAPKPAAKTSSPPAKGSKGPPPPAKGAAPSKPAGRVPPPSIKPGTGKTGPASAKGAPQKPGAKPDSKSAKPEAKHSPTGPKARYSVMSADAMAASRAAAAKLAAAAGLHPVKSTGNGDAPARNYTRLTKTPFDKKELAEFREMLLIKRRQIEGDVNAMETEALSGGGGSLSHLPQHMADQGTDTFDQSLALDLAASQRGLLKEIDGALARIDAGTYGICEEMGKPISVERLRHTPWARFCIEAARLHERGALAR